MSYEAVDGVVNPNGDWGAEGVFSQTLVFDEDNKIESAHEILRRLAEFGVTAEFNEESYILAYFPAGSARVMPGDTLTVFWSIGPDD